MSDSGDLFGDRMKLLEQAEAGRKFMPLLPILARIDGRSFSKFTRGLKRPYDERLSDHMVSVTKQLVEATGASVGYTQSDEISLAWYSDNYKSKLFFDGKIQKMTSQLGALASVYFNNGLADILGREYADKLPTFDARTWQVPTLIEGANTFLWREYDATKNSISMAAHHYFSHSSLQGLTGNQMQEKLFTEAGINWNTYPSFFKRGTYVRWIKTSSPFTTEELSQLPPKHHARTNPDMVVTRRKMSVEVLPPLGTVANRVDVLFFGAEPQLLCCA